MKTVIETTTAGTIEIDSTFKGDKTANWSGMSNCNNHRVTIRHKGNKFSFDFWASIANPKITKDSENIFAFYCALTDSVSAKESFREFCSNFGYDTDSINANGIYKACQRSLAKFDRVFDCDLYDLANEIQETYEC